MQSRLVRVDGIVTHYLEGGPADAPALVLIHDGAFGADGRTGWGPLLDLLSERFHVFAPDLLGFGQTDKVFDFGKDARRQRVDHVARWLDVVQVREAYFAGTSMGGGLTLLAAIDRSWPIRKGISLCGTAGLYQVSAQFQLLRDYEPSEAAMRRIVDLMVRRQDDFKEQLIRDRYQNSLIPGHWENLSAPRLRNPAASKPAANWMEAYLAALARTETPLMLVAGSDDPLMEPGWEERLAAHMPRCRPHRIEGGLHQPHLDAPEAFAETLFAFVDD